MILHLITCIEIPFPNKVAFTASEEVGQGQAFGGGHHSIRISKESGHGSLPGMCHDPTGPVCQALAGAQRVRFHCVSITLHGHNCNLRTDRGLCLFFSPDLCLPPLLPSS